MREITKLSITRTHEHARRLSLYEYMSTKRDENGIAYRLRFKPEESGEINNNLQLASLGYLKKRATKKESQRKMVVSFLLPEFVITKFH